MARHTNKIKLSEKWAGARFQYFRKHICGRSFVLTQSRFDSEQIAYGLQCIAPVVGQLWKEEEVTAVFKVRTSEFQNLCISGMSPHEVRKIVVETVRQMQLQSAVAAPVKRTHDSDHNEQSNGSTLYKLIDEYLADYKARVSAGRYCREVTSMKSYKAHQPNCDISTITADTLRTTVNHYRQRPKTAQGKSSAVATVRTTIKTIKAFYDWLDSFDKWIAPRRFEKLFKVRYAALRTPLEVKRDGGGVDTFTIAELVKLYAAATTRQRLYISVALNIGETAQGLASLLKDDIICNGDTWVIDRNRGKTGVRGVYPLWDETRQLVADEMNRDKDQPLLFLTMDRNPLVTYNKTSRVDSVSKTWANLLKKTPAVRKLGHKYLRKTGASLIAQLTNSDQIAELYLSHTGASVAQKHYLSKDFTHLADGLLKLRAHLAPMFAAATAATTKDTGAVKQAC